MLFSINVGVYLVKYYSQTSLLLPWIVKLENEHFFKHLSCSLLFVLRFTERGGGGAMIN